MERGETARLPMPTTNTTQRGAGSPYTAQCDPLSIRIDYSLLSNACNIDTDECDVSNKKIGAHAISPGPRPSHPIDRSAGSASDSE